MTEFQLRKKTYLFFGAPLLALIIGCSVFNVALFSSIFFIAGFLLPVIYITPGLEEKISSKKYALSFVKILFIIKNSSEKLLPLKDPAKEVIARHIPSLLMVNVIYTLTTKGLLPFWFLGVLLFEGIYRLYILSVGKRADAEIPQENSL